jgi:hypothetical protein
MNLVEHVRTTNEFQISGIGNPRERTRVTRVKARCDSVSAAVIAKFIGNAIDLTGPVHTSMKNVLRLCPLHVLDLLEPAQRDIVEASDAVLQQ